MKRALLILICVMSMLSMKASPVSYSAAVKMAAAFLNTKEVQLVNLAGKYGFNNLYAVSGENCFVLLSADDRAFPVLAYSFETPFSLDVAESTLDWIRSYDQEIQSLNDNRIEATVEVRQAWSDLMQGTVGQEANRAIVKPLVFSQWGQHAPYNHYCPGNCVTGCVATAMAQIMKYWEYPNQGTGYHTYTHSTYGSLSVSFGSTTYDWDYMPNGATSDSPTAVQQALGTLLYHCGVAVDMNYGTDESGAQASKVPEAMTNYFGYSSLIALVHKNSGYTDATWKALLKKELDASRPLFYSGQDLTYAHAFICDGYDSRDYFHFNWGWNGQNDGYYMIGALNPDHEQSYNVNNYVIMGIEPRPVSVGAPNNLVAAVNGSNVQLNWNAASGASYYKVYRDGELIASHVTGLSYTDSSVIFGRHRYFVRGVSSSGDRSRKSNEAEALVTIQVSTPTGLFAYIVDGELELYWNNPATETGSLYYKRSGYENDSYGNGGASTTYWAQRYPTSMLAKYEGLGAYFVEAYFIYPGEYTVYLCKGDHAGVTETITQQTLAITESGTQSFYLDEPFLLDCTKDLWMVLSAPASIPYPVAYCNYDGPGLEDACYISSDFSSWESMASDHVSWKMSVEVSDCPFIYTVLRNGTVIADDVHYCYYIDNDLSAGTQRYQLMARFNGVESSVSEAYAISLVDVNVLVSGYGKVEGDGFYETGDYVELKAVPNPGASFFGWRENGVTVSTDLDYRFYAYESHQLEARFTGAGVDDNESPMMEVYPNPIQSQMHIKSQAIIRKMEITDLNGETVDAKDVDADELEYSMEDLARGAYYLRLFTDKGIVMKKVIISK